MSGSGLRVALAGKGGAGKSVIAGTLARLLARRGRRVLLLDSDPMPGVALSLGAPEPEEPALKEIAEKGPDGRWRLRPGIGPARAIARCAITGPDGVRLLQLGKADAQGLENVIGAVNAFYAVVHRVGEPSTLASWDLVGDLPAGPRQVAARFSPYARTYLIVTGPGWPTVLAARRVARVVRAEAGTEALFVASRVAEPGDVERIEEMLGERIFAWIPEDQAVAEAEARGAAVLDAAPGSAAVSAIDGLAERLTRRNLSLVSAA